MIPPESPDETSKITINCRETDCLLRGETDCLSKRPFKGKGGGGIFL